jgi:AraC-like DNA-binding protein
MLPTLIRGEMDYWLCRPDAALGAGVKSYFIAEVGRRSSAQHELFMPDGYAELVFVFNGGYERAELGSAAPARRLSRSYVIGGRSRSIVTRESGGVKVIGVKLEPRLLRALLRSPLTALRDQVVELAELNDRGLLELEDRLASCQGVAETTATLDRFLLTRRAEFQQADPVVEHVTKTIRADRGGTPLTRTAKDLGIDPRTLERRFVAWCGMSAKAYARIARFKHAYHSFLHARDYLEGFYDQSHFIREFRFFTGASPTRLAARRMPESTDVTNLLLTHLTHHEGFNARETKKAVGQPTSSV